MILDLTKVPATDAICYIIAMVYVLASLHVLHQFAKSMIRNEPYEFEIIEGSVSTTSLLLSILNLGLIAASIIGVLVTGKLLWTLIVTCVASACFESKVPDKNAGYQVFPIVQVAAALIVIWHALMLTGKI